MTIPASSDDDVNGSLRHLTDHCDDSEDDPDSLRIIVARESRKLAKLARTADDANAREARRVADRDAAAQAVVDQSLTAADLQEAIDLLDDFEWQPPLAETRPSSSWSGRVLPTPAEQVMDQKDGSSRRTNRSQAGRAKRRGR